MSAKFIGRAATDDGMAAAVGQVLTTWLERIPSSDSESREAADVPADRKPLAAVSELLAGRAVYATDDLADDLVAELRTTLDDAGGRRPRAEDATAAWIAAEPVLTEAEIAELRPAFDAILSGDKGQAEVAHRASRRLPDGHGGGY